MEIYDKAIEKRKQELLDMKLHETIDVDKHIVILRVFGGWIYQFNCPPEDGTSYCTFVPEVLNIETLTPIDCR